MLHSCTWETPCTELQVTQHHPHPEDIYLAKLGCMSQPHAALACNAQPTHPNFTAMFDKQMCLRTHLDSVLLLPDFGPGTGVVGSCASGLAAQSWMLSVEQVAGEIDLLQGYPDSWECVAETVHLIP
jgi:hypothetical protein